MNLGPVEIGLIVLAVMLLFGYRKLPDASRALGRSLRIFRSEVEEARAPVEVVRHGADRAWVPTAEPVCRVRRHR
jgi:TatA/E family protein of Tat protein translocase